MHWNKAFWEKKKILLIFLARTLEVDLNYNASMLLPSFGVANFFSVRFSWCYFHDLVENDRKDTKSEDTYLLNVGLLGQNLLSLCRKKIVYVKRLPTFFSTHKNIHNSDKWDVWVFNCGIALSGEGFHTSTRLTTFCRKSTRTSSSCYKSNQAPKIHNFEAFSSRAAQLGTRCLSCLTWS